MIGSPLGYKSGVAAGPNHLRALLEGHGPLRAAFGRYLALRSDVLPAAVCAQLSGIADVAPPSPEMAVRELFNREFGYPPEMVFSRFDPYPFESRLLWQAHYAWLAGQYVVVRIVHPELASSAVFEIPEPVRESLLDCGAEESALAQVVAGFRDLLPAMLSFAGEAAAAERLSSDAASFGFVAAPAVHGQLCTAHIAVMRQTGPRASSNRTGWAPEQARVLVVSWLRQALQGSVYPIDPCLENVEISGDGRIAFPFGPYQTLPETTKVHLWEYLLALAAHDADQACVSLCKELLPDRNDPDNEALRRRFRQMVPFRDSTFDIGAAGPGATEVYPLTGEIAIHWRIAAESGRMDQSKLLPFYLGLMTVARSAGHLAPGRDWLDEALRDMGIQGAFDRFKNFLRPPEMAATLEGYAAAMLAFPQNMDKALNRGLPGAGLPAPPSECGGEPVRSNDRFAVAVSLMLAFAGLLLLVQKFGGRLASGNGIGFLAVLIVGAGLLLIGTRSLRG